MTGSPHFRIIPRITLWEKVKAIFSGATLFVAEGIRAEMIRPGTDVSRIHVNAVNVPLAQGGEIVVVGRDILDTTAEDVR